MAGSASAATTDAFGEGVDLIEHVLAEAEGVSKLESLVRNRVLGDGGKRIGWLATVVYYGLHAVPLDAPDDDAYGLVITVAGGAVAYRRAGELLASRRRP